MDGHLTRSVESVSYDSHEYIPIHIQPHLVLEYACERMSAVQGRMAFKRMALSELSVRQFTMLFWLIFCAHFQEGSEGKQNELLAIIGAQQVKMLKALRSNTDFFYKGYPYLVSSAISWAFHYMFPGSRHLYTSRFKHQVFVLVNQVLLGYSLCPTSMQVARKRYFPDEVLLDETQQNNPSSASAASGQPENSSGTSAAFHSSSDASLLQNVWPAESNATTPAESKAARPFTSPESGRAQAPRVVQAKAATASTNHRVSNIGKTLREFQSTAGSRHHGLQVRTRRLET